MTQDDDSVASRSASSAARALPVGKTLQAARLAKGWTLDEVAGRIKFSARQIDALENEIWAELPAGVSLRGLIRNYARLLGADPQALMASLEPDVREIGPVRINPGSLHSAHSLPQSTSDFERGTGSKLWFFVIFLVLLAGVVYAFWRGWLPTAWLPASWSDLLTK